ncbi:MAG TPA: hypothetical protein VFJ24_01635 [Gaiellales bacterium]|nr:hypothetical protein [Gaiellales bacterium]
MPRRSLTELRLARAARALERRRSAATFDAAALTFGPQTSAVMSTAKQQVWCCSRRAGKSTGEAVKLLAEVMRPPFTNVFYLSLTLKNAKRIIWHELKRLNEVYRLGGVPDDQEGVLAFPRLGHDVHVYLGGVKDASEVEKVRGPKAKGYVLDEAQSMPPRVIGPLMKDAIGPALLDNDGWMIVSGTPGPINAGYFWDICEGALSSEWERHKWTWRDNPWIQAGRSREDIEADILKRFGLTRDSPTYLREWCGLWHVDRDVLVFRYDAARNGFAELPAKGEWSYVIGIDIGFEDADAIAVLGWRAKDRAVYLVEEYVRRKSTITELAEKVAELRAKYAPLRMVADFGGLGKKIGEEFRRRFALPVEPADKVRKIEHIELLNDAMRAGLFMARPGGPFAEDAAIVQWDQDARAKGERKIADDYHSDITDAVLYGFRACRAYLEIAPEERPADPNDQAEAEARAYRDQVARLREMDDAQRDAAEMGFELW